MRKVLSLLLVVLMLSGTIGNIGVVFADKITPTANLISVAYSEKLDIYVSVASDGQLYTSGDGINWGPGEKFAPSVNLGTIVGNGYYVTPDAIIWNPDSEEFVLAAGDKLYRSGDGFAWGDAITPKAGGATLVIHTLFWDGSKYWAATTTGGQVAFANDDTLTSWTTSSTGANKAIDGFAKASNGRLFVCTTLSNSKTLYYTDNGTTWTDGTTNGVNPYRTTSIQYSKKLEKILIAGGVASDKSSTKNGAVGRADVSTGITEARLELKEDTNNASPAIPAISDFVVYDTYNSSNTITEEEVIAVSYTGAISYRLIGDASDFTKNRKWKSVAPASGEIANTLGLTSVIRGKNGYVAVGGDPSNHDRTGTGGVAIFIPDDYTQGYRIGNFDDNTTGSAYSLYINGNDETEIPSGTTATFAYTATVRDVAGKPIENSSNTIIWNVSGDDLTGITVRNGVLSVASNAKEQTIVITATDSTDVSLCAEKTVAVKSAVPGITSMKLFRDNLVSLPVHFSTLTTDYTGGENCTKWLGTDYEQTRMWIDGSFDGAGDMNLVASVSFYPTDSLEELFFATTDHEPIHEKAINAENWISDAWNTMSVAINTENNKNSLYLNGEFISDYEVDVDDTIVLVAWAKDDNLLGTTVYIDDFCINEGVYALPLITTELTVSGDDIINLAGKTNAQIKQEITVNDPRFSATITYNGSEVSDSAAVLNGSKYTIAQKGNFVGEYVLKTSQPLASHVVYRDGVGSVFGAKYSTVENAVLDGEPCSVMTGTELQDSGNQMFLYISNEEVVGTGNKDIVFSFSVYPTSSMKHIMIATSGHVSIVPVIQVGDLEAGKWNEISVVIDGATSTNTLYVNGELRERRVQAVKSGTLRLCVYSSQEVLEGTTCYIDNMALSIGSASFPAITSNLILDGMYINGYGGMSYANISSVLKGTNPDTTFKFFENGTEVVNTSALSVSGAHIAVYTGGVFVSEYILGTANYAMGEYSGYNNGVCGDKFSIGTFTSQLEVNAFSAPIDAMAVLAQYNDTGMINCNVEYHTLSGKDVADVSLDIEQTEGTYLKFFLFEQDSFMPLTDAVTILPYSDVYVENVIPMYKGFTTKAATFSYDDGVANDINTIASLDKYGAKATFNVVAKQSNGTTDRFLNYYKDKGTTDEERFAYIKELYKNHEIANHSYSHLPVQLEEGQTSQDSGGNTLTGISGDEVISQIADNHNYIKDNLGIDMIGIAWPYSSPYNRSDYVNVRDEILNSGYKYARYHTNSMSFDLPEDWFRWPTSAHIAKMPELTEKFVALPEDGKLKLLYIWGHSYEYADPERYGSGDWTTLEENLEKLNNAGVWFGTNREVYDYVNAVNKITTGINTVTNNSDITIYVQVNGKNVELEAGEIYCINESQSSSPVIACWGDSLTWGQGSTDKITKSYPGVLAELSGATVYNMGVGGETSTTIAAKQGALDIVFTEGFTIPVSCNESVEIKFAASNGGVVTPRDSTIGGWTPCTINGVEGLMEIVVDSSVWPRVLKSAHFKRNVSGEAVKVNVGDKLIPYAQKITPDINIVFSGTNGGWTSANTTVPSDYSADITEFLNLLDNQRKLSNTPDKYIIIGLTAGDDARWGSLDSAMEEKFGENFLDLRAFLSSEEAMEMAGIEPTENDVAAMESGAVPPSFLVSDGTHFNDTGYELIGYCVYDKLTELGYLN